MASSMDVWGSSWVCDDDLVARERYGNENEQHGEQPFEENFCVRLRTPPFGDTTGLMHISLIKSFEVLCTKF